MRTARDVAHTTSHPNTTGYALAFVGMGNILLRDMAG